MRTAKPGVVERLLQRCLYKLQEWADTNGFKFSTIRLYACIFVVSANFILTHSSSLMVALFQS